MSCVQIQFNQWARVSCPIVFYISIGKHLFQVGFSCGFPLLLSLCLPKIPKISHGMPNFAKFNVQPKLLKFELGEEFWNANWFPITLFISIYWNSLFHPFLIEMVHNKIFELTFHCGNKALTFTPKWPFQNKCCFPKRKYWIQFNIRSHWKIIV